MQGITLHQMEIFEAVARHQSYTRAAEELYITQPTVSIQIKQLTKTVGLPLITHVGKKLYLTSAGEALLATCQKTFASLSDLNQELISLRGVKEGVVKLAVVESGKHLMLPHLKSFVEKYPGLTVSLYVGNYQDLVERLKNNEDDIYFLSSLPDLNSIESIPYGESHLRLLTSVTHPLALRSSLSFPQLAHEHWLLRESGSTIRTITKKLLEKHKLDIKISLEFSNNEAVKASALTGLGIAILPDCCLFSNYHDDLKALPLADEILKIQWHITYLKTKFLSPPAKAFLSELCESHNDKLSSIAS